MRFAVTVTLNIGLNVPDGEYMDPVSTAHLALDALAEHLSIKRYRARIAFAQGTEAGTRSIAGEDTLVLEVRGVGTDPRGPCAVAGSVHKLSEKLGQDCIAFRSSTSFDEDGYGPFQTHEALVGPKAEAWGEFDPKLFITYNGWQE